MGCLSGSYRRFVILLAVPPHSSRQLLCPSASFIQPLLIRSIAPCSLPCCLLQCLAPCRKTQPQSGRMHSHFRKLTARLTWLHSTASSLFHFSRLQSTRCQLLFCSPAAPLRLRSPCGCYCSCRTSILQSIAKVHLHSSATFVPCGKYTPVASYGAGIAFVPHALLPSPLWGLAVRLHDVVPPYSGGRQTARNPCSADKCAARLCFFFAAGAFTGNKKGNH